MNLGDRMKIYENMSTPKRVMPLSPVIARLDGKAFHSFCRGLEKPFDIRFMDLMNDVTSYLVEKSNALVGYTQSDEISLLFYSDNMRSQIFMDGKIQKMISILAAMATARFNSVLDIYLPEKSEKIALFDCRVFSVPTKIEAVNCFLWREQDATRNSIQSAGQTYFSHKRLHKLNCNQIQDLLWKEKNINWNDYMSGFKRGRWVQKRIFMRKFFENEIEKLPKKHEARTNPGLIVKRTEVSLVYLPQLNKIKNKIDVVFNGSSPEVVEDDEI